MILIINLLNYKTTSLFKLMLLYMGSPKLLANLPGSGSFKSGDPSSRGQQIESVADNAIAINS